MQQYIGFTLDAVEYSVPILKVREIVNMPLITTIPQSPDYIEGVTNLRGTIIPVVNLKRLVNLNGNGEKGTKVIVISSGKVTFGIVVDGITGVIKISEGDVEPPERFLNEGIDKVEGVAKLKDRLVVLLDPKKLLPCEDLRLFEDVIDVKESVEGDVVEVTKTVQTLAGEVQVREFHNAKQFLQNKGIDTADPRYMIFDDLLRFINAISDSDYAAAEQTMMDIVHKGQGDLFKEVGKVTRKLHDAVRSFNEAIDPKIKGYAINDMPRAVDRLQYVIDKTEEAANKTMSIVEAYVLKMDELGDHIKKLQGPEESIKYLREFKNRLEDDITEIITTQSFQDLTGQTIKKVISLVADIEEELVRLITTFGGRIDPVAEPAFKEADKISQAGVDDLLKEFGF